MRTGALDGLPADTLAAVRAELEAERARRAAEGGPMRDASTARVLNGWDS
jgi:hypothetical protein